MTVQEAWAWGTGAFNELYDRIEQAGQVPAGPGGALFPAGFFELHQAELTAFVPVGGPVPGSVTIAGMEAALTRLMPRRQRPA